MSGGGRLNIVSSHQIFSEIVQFLCKSFEYFTAKTFSHCKVLNFQVRFTLISKRSTWH